ncbi:hypothetical protein BX666DRAFT_2125614 [Dichotomocladium elegans]|nr:hypothetical protein BX666DRAFT_2125614 [Dichotomocladium elegans]
MEYNKRQQSFPETNAVQIDMTMRKIELSHLTKEDLNHVLFFRPGAKDDPSYRRVSLAALEYMKDIKSQLIADIKDKTGEAMYAREPPDTDSTLDIGKESSNGLIDGMFLFTGPNEAREEVASQSAISDAPSGSLYHPKDLTEEPSAPIPVKNIESYRDLFKMAAERFKNRRGVKIARIRDLDLEPLFDHMTQCQPASLAGLQDVFLLIRSLRPHTTDCESSLQLEHSSITRIPEDSGIHSESVAWEKNFTLFIHTANIMMGDFHGTLPYYWLNNAALARYRRPAHGAKHPRIPSLQELDKSSYSISAFQRIKGGIRIKKKNVSVQILSLLDFRYRNADVADDGNYIFQYYCDSMVKLSKLVPNKRSFDIAVDVGMIPADMTSLVDFTWWTNNVIKAGREFAARDLGKETYDLFLQLEGDYYSFFKSIRRDTKEQLNYNPVQFSLTFIMVWLSVMSLCFAAFGIIQVMQGFCVWKQYC